MIIWIKMSISFDSRYQQSQFKKKQMRYVHSLRKSVKFLSSLNNHRLSQQHWMINKVRRKEKWKRREEEGAGCSWLAIRNMKHHRANVRVATQYVWESICMQLHSSEHAWQTRPEVRKHLNLMSSLNISLSCLKNNRRS